MNIGHVLTNHAKYRPDHLAFVYKDRRLTYAELNKSVNKIANALYDHGIRKGDKVAMLLPNSDELWELYWALAKLGAVAVPLSPLLAGMGLSNQLNNADTDLVVTLGKTAPKLEEVFSDLQLHSTDIWLTDTKNHPRFESFHAHKNKASEIEPPEENTHPDDLYNIIYSSGTTGEPKGIMHTHRIRAAYMSLFGNYYRMTPESVVLHTGSIIFNGSFLTTMPIMFLGGTFVLHPAFDVDELVTSIKAEKITHTILVPSQIISALQHEDFTANNAASLEMILSVGAPLHKAHKEALNRRIPNVFYELYGLTEGFVTILDKTDFHKKPGSVGCPPQFFEMRILDDGGNEVTTGTIGEIVGKGPILMQGYYKDPRRTEEAIKDGWLYTGDLGYVDEDGYLFLTGRKKDLIISGGVNVYPKDIEVVITRHPKVKEVAVFGVPDERWGETPVAAIVCKKGNIEIAENLKIWINERIDARFQKIKDVYLLDDFPRNVAGKTLKRTIKEMYLNQKDWIMDKYIDTGRIKLHYLEKVGPDKPVIILMHGLTANAHSFDSYLKKLKGFHVLSVDLRGRGLSDKPDSDYSMKDHAKDIIGMMDALDIQQAVIGGHSFGALLSIFLAAHYPDRVLKLILIDAAARLHPNVKEMVAPAMLRLGQTWESYKDYLNKIKKAPYMNGRWLPEMESYYKADTKQLPNGTITTQSRLEHIAQAIEGALGPGEKWLEYISGIEHPSLLINAIEPYGPSGDPILPEELALETVHMMKNCTYKKVSGNHMTMLFGKGADEATEAIESFLNR